jgi:hypothetical protein
MTIRIRAMAQKEYDNCGREPRKVEMRKQAVDD